MMSRSVPFLLH
uniref:Uncharacterized protein n=1 Tax=Anguilla anguilla TaxID=7936 RepID=A0A0E9PMU0_ANGAN